MFFFLFARPSSLLLPRSPPLRCPWHLVPCRGSSCFVHASQVRGTWWPLAAPVLVPWLWPAACLSGVPCGPASVRRSSSGPVALGAPVSFPVAVVPSPTPGAVAPGFTGWLRGARGGRPRTGLMCLPLAPAEARALGALRVVPVRGPAMGLSLAPSRFGLGLRALRWFGVCGPGH